MFDEILRNATLPGAFVSAAAAARERDLKERRRRGGYKVEERPAAQPRVAVLREKLMAVFSRRSHGT